MAIIYKITNTITNKSYIGETKSVNPFTRWRQHKNTIENNRGCPALQDAVKKYGIENFKFEILIFCFDEDRYKLEIDYIKKYKTKVPNGYNISKGGTGGGFEGKTHTEETREKIKQNLKKKYVDNPELRKEISERNKVIMKDEEVRNKIKDGMKNSEKWNNAVEEKKIGGNLKPSTETKNKISESLKKYYSIKENNIINIQKHRDRCAEVKGVKIKQFDTNNNLLNEFKSINEASRVTGIARVSINYNLKNKLKHAGGFIWKKIESE